ncbi:LysR substrate-binding domain-containing protein [Actinacidiphila sp. SB3-2]
MAHQAREWSVVASLVAHGLGIALVPATADLPPQAGLVRTPLAGSPAPSRRFLRVLRSGSAEHPAIAEAVSLLDGLAKDRRRSLECPPSAQLRQADSQRPQRRDVGVGQAQGRPRKRPPNPS